MWLLLALQPSSNTQQQCGPGSKRARPRACHVLSSQGARSSSCNSNNASSKSCLHQVHACCCLGCRTLQQILLLVQQLLPQQSRDCIRIVVLDAVQHADNHLRKAGRTGEMCTGGAMWNHAPAQLLTTQFAQNGRSNEGRCR